MEQPTAPDCDVSETATSMAVMPAPPLIDPIQNNQDDTITRMPTPVTVASVCNSSRKGKSVVPECYVSLRRSTRSNKYDGFKVPPLTDSKIKSSKVKPRHVPSALTISDTPVEQIPPATPIEVIQ